MSRPPVGIERLPRHVNHQPRQSMNCKSCRKRKIKCNRLRPACEACQVFQCPCIYDAVPKKRGPKTDVLEALLKRVDGLEKQLKPSEPESPASTSPAPMAMVEAFFAHCHRKPFYILDEATTRQQIQLEQLPRHTMHAMFAVSVRYLSRADLCDEYAARANAACDRDTPSISNLQTLLLLKLAATAVGNGCKSYMILASAIGMAVALELHRESDCFLSAEREHRRRLFWTCYILDRFASCGSKRPPLLADHSIALQLPSTTMEMCQSGPPKEMHGVSVLVDIVRILGTTDRYLAAGGVKGDSHFPWHAMSNLSKIRLDLDAWAAATDDIFTTLFSQPDTSMLVLSKLVFHLIHCLMYRPFLPIDLAELSGSGQHQSWQIEATNHTFLHANAITDLVDLAQLSSVGLPPFAGHCLFSAGTIHIHGVHYHNVGDPTFSESADYLSREMQHLTDLQTTWSLVQRHRDTLQAIYGCHSDLVKSLATNPLRFTPVFHLEDFFDRYNTLGKTFDPAHISFDMPPPETSVSPAEVAAAPDHAAEKDPFLSLLEQLAENEHSQAGPSELDYFLT